MMFRKVTLNVATTVAMLAGLSGCGPGGHGTSSPPSPSPQATPRQTTDGTRTTDEEIKPRGPSVASSVPTRYGDVAHGTSFPPARPNLTPAPATTPSATDLASVRDAALDKVSQTADFVIDVALPANGERTTREAGLAEARRVSDEYRHLNPAELKRALTMNSPDADAIKALLQSRGNDDVIKQLTRVLTDPDPTRAASSASLLISEVFSDADYSSSKLAQISFDLGEIAKRGYYDEAVASRVAYLQSRLDYAAYRDHAQSIAKVALFVVGSAVTSGVLAGRQVQLLDRATGVAHGIPFADLLKMPSIKGLAERGLQGATSLEKITEAAAKRMPAPAIDVVRSELKVLSFTDTEINRMGLERAKVRDIAYLAGDKAPAYSVKPEWMPTNRDRLQFAITDHWDGPLTGKRVLLFRVQRRFRRAKVILGPQYTEAEAAEVAQRLARDSKVEYLNMVEGEEVTQTAIRADTRPEFQRKPIAQRLGPTPDTPTFAPRAPLPEVEPRKFDYVRAAIAATAVGALTTPPAFLGFAYGTRDGRDKENLYLERQVDRMARPPATVVSDLNQK